jgi:ankyrin
MQQGHDKVVSVLLENDLKGKTRLPALHIAAKKDDCKAADLLLQVIYHFIYIRIHTHAHMH